MEKTIIGLVAALGAAAPLVSAQAAVAPSEDASRALQANSIAELLNPSPANAAAILAALDAQPAASVAPKTDAKGVQLAWHHHHHHYHHHYYHHHHHYYHHHYYHHHHHACFISPLGYICP